MLPGIVGGLPIAVACPFGALLTTPAPTSGALLSSVQLSTILIFGMLRLTRDCLSQLLSFTDVGQETFSILRHGGWSAAKASYRSRSAAETLRCLVYTDELAAVQELEVVYSDEQCSPPAMGDLDERRRGYNISASQLVVCNILRGGMIDSGQAFKATA